MSPLLEEFTPRELVLSILGKAGRRILSNRTTTNQQLLTDYLDLITITHAPSYTSPAKRLLGKFFDFLGEFPHRVLSSPSSSSLSTGDGLPTR